MTITSDINLQGYRKNKRVKFAAFWNRLTRKFAGVIIIINLLKKLKSGCLLQFLELVTDGFLIRFF